MNTQYTNLENLLTRMDQEWEESYGTGADCIETIRACEAELEQLLWDQDGVRCIADRETLATLEPIFTSTRARAKKKVERAYRDAEREVFAWLVSLQGLRFAACTAVMNELGLDWKVWRGTKRARGVVRVYWGVELEAEGDRGLCFEISPNGIWHGVGAPSDIVAIADKCAKRVTEIARGLMQ